LYLIFVTDNIVEFSHFQWHRAITDRVRWFPYLLVAWGMKRSASLIFVHGLNVTFGQTGILFGGQFRRPDPLRTSRDYAGFPPFTCPNSGRHKPIITLQKA
ncbi:MAG: hypothetical protein ACRD28_05820, partial [Acidobacteriaceae bacterium]